MLALANIACNVFEIHWGWLLTIIASVLTHGCSTPASCMARLVSMSSLPWPRCGAGGSGCAVIGPGQAHRPDRATGSQGIVITVVGWPSSARLRAAAARDH